MNEQTLSLFDFEAVPDRTVAPLGRAEAQRFIERWHYSGRCPTGKNIFFGGYINGELYCVSDYGIGVNAYQSSFLSRETGHVVTDSNLLELKRLCRSEPRQNWPLTQFLSQCHKTLKAQGYKYIVSFSDPEHGHNGGIYRAANFQHIGQSSPEFHLVDENGEKRHRRYAFRYARRNGIDVAEARDRLGVSRQKTAPKDRWFLCISKK